MCPMARVSVSFDRVSNSQKITTPLRLSSNDPMGNLDSSSFDDYLRHVLSTGATQIAGFAIQPLKGLLHIILRSRRSSIRLQKTEHARSSPCHAFSPSPFDTPLGILPYGPNITHGLRAILAIALSGRGWPRIDHEEIPRVNRG